MVAIGFVAALKFSRLCCSEKEKKQEKAVTLSKALSIIVENPVRASILCTLLSRRNRRGISIPLSVSTPNNYQKNYNYTDYTGTYGAHSRDAHIYNSFVTQIL